MKTIIVLAIAILSQLALAQNGTNCSNSSGTLRYELAEQAFGMPPRVGALTSEEKIYIDGNLMSDIKHFFGEMPLRPQYEVDFDLNTSKDLSNVSYTRIYAISATFVENYVVGMGPIMAPRTDWVVCKSVNVPMP